MSEIDTILLGQTTTARITPHHGPKVAGRTLLAGLLLLVRSVLPPARSVRHCRRVGDDIGIDWPIAVDVVELPCLPDRKTQYLARA